MSARPFDRGGAAVMGSAGAMLIGVGALEIAAHLTPLVPVYASLCGAAGPLSAAHLLLSESSHCWGCPVALAGSLVLLGTLLGPEARRASASGAGLAGGFAR